MSKLSCFIAFTAGVVVGSLVTWRVTETKYKKIANEEIESVKAAYSKPRHIATDDSEEATEEDSPSDEEEDHHQPKMRVKDEYRHIVGNYIPGRMFDDDEKEAPSVPYVISPDEFGDEPGYDTMDLTYYSDGVLADDGDEEIGDIENCVGTDFMNHFDEYDDGDVVHIRNRDRKMDYEISKDNRSFSEVTGKDPSGGVKDDEDD